MSRDDLIPVWGTVTDAHAGGRFSVLLENGTTVNAYLSGKMRQNKIRVVLGDRVQVEMSPYDLTKGRLHYRDRGGATSRPSAGAKGPTPAPEE